MKINLFSLVAFYHWWFVVAAIALHQQLQSPVTRQVAIIGAGAAGSSTAYHLRQFAEEAGVALNITLFERTGQIGGRSLVVHVFENRSYPIELGASIFVKKNEILHTALNDFGLKAKAHGSKLSDLVGIWDGDEFVFTIDTSQSSWWLGLKVVLKYGLMGPRNAGKLVKEASEKFLRLYKAPFFPFRSLTQRAWELDMAELAGMTGAQYLAKHNIPEAFSHDMVQAATRVNYASNLDTIHALDTMVAQAGDGAMAVEGGNYQLFEGMVERAGVALYLDTSVNSITRKPSEVKSLVETGRPKYLVETSSNKGKESTESFVFDDVVMATPYQYSNIDADQVIQVPMPQIPYIKLHVTLFSTPWELSHQYFNLTEKEELPGMILTTLAGDDIPPSGVQGVGKAGFYSINIIRKVTNPNTDKEEYLYKIFSAEKVTSHMFSRLLGVKVPSNIILESGGSSDQTMAVSPISWYHAREFNAYPQALPRSVFTDPIIGPGLYYTSGMEAFISCMESNALMGKNVARLLVDDIIGVSSGGFMEKSDLSEQHVLDL